MAHEEHLNRLKQGAWTWNQWRAEHPEIKPDVTDVDFSGADLSLADLSEADLSFADLSQTRITKTSLVGANLEQACFIGAMLKETDLRGIPWEQVMALALQPGIVWEDVQYDQPSDAELFPQKPGD